MDAHIFVSPYEACLVYSISTPHELHILKNCVLRAPYGLQIGPSTLPKWSTLPTVVSYCTVIERQPETRRKVKNPGPTALTFRNESPALKQGIQSEPSLPFCCVFCRNAVRFTYCRHCANMKRFATHRSAILRLTAIMPYSRYPPISAKRVVTCPGARPLSNN